MPRLQRPPAAVSGLVIGTALIVAVLLVAGVFRTPTQAQGASVTLDQGGNNIVYQGDALPVVDALNDAASAVAAVWSFDAPSQQWRLWNPNLPDPLQGFNSLESGAAYWVEATRSTAWTFPTAGSVSRGATGPVSLSPGFNNVAYGGPSLPVVDALGDIAANVSTIWAFDAPSQSWLLWTPSLPGPLQGFTSLDPGRTYWLVTSSAVTWTIGGGDPEGILFFSTAFPYDRTVSTVVIGDIVYRLEGSRNADGTIASVDRVVVTSGSTRMTVHLRDDLLTDRIELTDTTTGEFTLMEFDYQADQIRAVVSDPLNPALDPLEMFVTAADVPDLFDILTAVQGEITVSRSGSIHAASAPELSVAQGNTGTLVIDVDVRTASGQGVSPLSVVPIIEIPKAFWETIDSSIINWDGILAGEFVRTIGIPTAFGYDVIVDQALTNLGGGRFHGEVPVAFAISPAKARAICSDVRRSWTNISRGVGVASLFNPLDLSKYPKLAIFLTSMGAAWATAEIVTDEGRSACGVVGDMAQQARLAPHSVKVRIDQSLRNWQPQSLNQDLGVESAPEVFNAQNFVATPDGRHQVNLEIELLDLLRVELTPPDPFDATASQPYLATADGGATANDSRGEPYLFEWESNGAVASVQETAPDQSTANITFAAGGLGTADVKATDGNQNFATARFQTDFGDALVVEIGRPRGPLHPETPVRFVANIVSGFAPEADYEYSWFLDGVKIGSAETVVVTFDSTGPKTIRVEVNDPVAEEQGFVTEDDDEVIVTVEQRFTTWNSGIRCDEADATDDFGHTWTVHLFHDEGPLRSSVAFHNCPNGGRLRFSFNDTTPLEALRDTLTGGRAEARGPLSTNPKIPARPSFNFVVGRPPAPNYAARADVSTTISVDPGSVPIGESVELRVGVTNSGPEDAAPTQVVIRAGGTIVDIDTTSSSTLLECQIVGTIATCVFEQFPTGSAVTIVIAVTGDSEGAKSASSRVAFPDWGRDPLPTDNAASTSYTVFDPEPESEPDP